MTRSLLYLLCLAAVAGISSSTPLADSGYAVAPPPPPSAPLPPRDNKGLTPGCKNGPKSRKCWGKYDINTNWYDTIFKTGRTREYWLVLEQKDCAPDGFKRQCLMANGTMPGPAIVADWGDDVVVHVTNKIASNGTAIHWHGMRQLHTMEYDGAPGVTQCPIAPGETLTYKFHASQYGSAMYHSHFSVQYSDGLFGPLIINGPASADYDEDLGLVVLQDWNHHTAFVQWADIANFRTWENGTDTALINGMNTGNCVAINGTAKNPNCVGDGKKAEFNFEAGKKYRMRILNLASEAWYQFSIDGHKLKVISTDLVPIVPYDTDSVLVNAGQRYDVIVEANAKPDDYWLRMGHVTACISNQNLKNLTGIVRYNKKSKKDPKSTNTVVPIETCMDEDPGKLVPWVPLDVPNMEGGIHLNNVTGQYYQGKFLRWSMNIADGGFMWTNWSQPAIGDVKVGNIAAVPKQNNILPIGALDAKTAEKYKNPKIPAEWVVIVIDELTPIPGVSHPIHIHGHDFLILDARPRAKWDGTMTGWNTKNPPRRDTVIMPPNGYIAVAFALDNPGLWLMHCHIAWHSSQGLGATFMESPAMIPSDGGTADWNSIGSPMCKKWNGFYHTSEWHQDDSGV